MGFKDWFRKDEVIGTRVLVCSFSEKIDDNVSNDALVYSRYYSTTVRAVRVAFIGQILSEGYDVVHVFCDVSKKGVVTDYVGDTITGTELVEICLQSGVKLLWIARENLSEAYISDFRAQGKKLNLIMTLVRNGLSFSEFLDQLLGKMRFGATIPVAWAQLAPHHTKDIDVKIPSCIFFAGRGGVILR
jgi:hypothetical protein